MTPCVAGLVFIGVGRLSARPAVLVGMRPTIRQRDFCADFAARLPNPRRGCARHASNVPAGRSGLFEAIDAGACRAGPHGPCPHRLGASSWPLKSYRPGTGDTRLDQLRIRQTGVRLVERHPGLVQSLQKLSSIHESPVLSAESGRSSERQVDAVATDQEVMSRIATDIR